MEEERLFIGVAIKASWPSSFPDGKILKEEDRHLTLFFLGDQNPSNIIPVVEKVPLFSVGLAGICSEILFLPKDHSNVAAYKIDWKEREKDLKELHSSIFHLLEKTNVKWKNDRRELLSHVTVARRPQNKRQWEKDFSSFPCIATSLVLYQSLGNSEYAKRIEREFLLPYEEFAHTADLAFHIRGYNYGQLFFHAQLALADSFPELMEFIQPTLKENSVDSIVMQLNEMITKADIEMGAPIKAVSYHGIEKKEGDHMIWELIVDV